MSKVMRPVLKSGLCYEILHAVCADFSSPSLVALTEMGEGKWQVDPELKEIPDDAQIKHAQKLKVGIEFFADHGYPLNSYCTVNNLRDGVWEFRLGSVRISFYDTDGQGNYLPKLRILDIRDSESEVDSFWWIPIFSPYVRLGHAFGKLGDEATESDIDETFRVRNEDLYHDR